MMSSRVQKMFMPAVTRLKQEGKAAVPTDTESLQANAKGPPDTAEPPQQSHQSPIYPRKI